MTVLASIKAYLVVAGVAILATLAALLRARQDGRNAAIVEAAAKKADAIKARKETDDEVEHMDNAAVDGELDRWMRDGKR